MAAAVAGGAACQRTPQPGAAASEGRPSAPASPAVGSWRPFEPPADGRLTAAQVEMYVAVRRRALELAKSGPDTVVPEKLAEIAASERRAVRDAGRDVDEYLWVSARIADASRVDARALGGLAAAIEGAARAGREQIVEGTARQPSPATPAAAAPEDPARAHNRELLGRYRAQLDAVLPSPALPPPRPAPKS
jgi:hypothetical protein